MSCAPFSRSTLALTAVLARTPQTTARHITAVWPGRRPQRGRAQHRCGRISDRDVREPKATAAYLRMHTHAARASCQCSWRASTCGKVRYPYPPHHRSAHPGPQTICETAQLPARTYRLRLACTWDLGADVPAAASSPRTRVRRIMTRNAVSTPPVRAGACRKGRPPLATVWTCRMLVSCGYSRDGAGAPTVGGMGGGCVSRFLLVLVSAVS